MARTLSSKVGAVKCLKRGAGSNPALSHARIFFITNQDSTGKVMAKKKKLGRKPFQKPFGSEEKVAVFKGYELARRGYCKIYRNHGAHT